MGKNRGSKEERKPTGRYAAESVAVSPEFKDASRIQFTATNRRQYVIDFHQMVQRSVLTGNRRAVRRDGASGTWYYDTAMQSHKQQQQQHGPNWVAYATSTQKKLEKSYDVFSEFHGGSSAPTDDGSRQDWRLCKCGEPLIMTMASEDWFCDGCRRHVHVRSVAVARYLCSKTADKCNYDLCGCCVTQSVRQTISAVASVEETLSLVQDAPACTLSEEQIRAACDAAFAPGARLQLALRILKVLAERHLAQFNVDDARRAALSLGSMSALQIVMRSNPDLQLQGLAIFDRRYPGLKINDDRFKRCIKALVARGAQLGQPGLSFVPSSKLLRKFEADAFPAWVDRCFSSIRASGLKVPDVVQQNIEAFLELRSQ